MRKPQGYATLTDPDGKQEWDTVTCAHCNGVEHVKPMGDPADMGGLCKVCMGLVCKRCVGRGCDPFEKKLERMEARDLERRRSYG